jgi:hypothetical protein
MSAADFGRPASYTILMAYQPQSNTTHWILGSGDSSNPNFLGVIRNNSGAVGTYYGDNSQFTLSEVAGAFTVGVQRHLARRRETVADALGLAADIHRFHRVCVQHRSAGHVYGQLGHCQHRPGLSLGVGAV